MGIKTNVNLLFALCLFSFSLLSSESSGSLLLCFLSILLVWGLRHVLKPSLKVSSSYTCCKHQKEKSIRTLYQHLQCTNATALLLKSNHVKCNRSMYICTANTHRPQKPEAFHKMMTVTPYHWKKLHSEEENNSMYIHWDTFVEISIIMLYNSCEKYLIHAICFDSITSSKTLCIVWNQ